MNKKGLNTTLKMYNFSILDDENVLEKNTDLVAYKIKLYNELDFCCYTQALYDIMTELIKNKQLVNFCHLLNIYNRNIYIASIGITPDSRCVVTSFTNKEFDEISSHWCPIKYIRQHVQYFIDKIISVDFNSEHPDLKNYFSNVYISEQSVKFTHIIYSILSISVNHTNPIMIEFEQGLYRNYEEYKAYYDQIIELLRIEVE